MATAATASMNDVRLLDSRPALANRFLCEPRRGIPCSSSRGGRCVVHLLSNNSRRLPQQRWAMAGAARAAATAEKRKAFYPGEDKGFVEEMRFVAMKLHRKDQSSEGEKEAEADDKPLAKWEPSVHGYIKFLVDSKAVYDTMESIVQEASHPSYAEFRNTGLERAAALSKDLEWFKSQGYEIPEPGEPGLTYSAYLKELAENDPPAFICHFYNVYFAHSAGGRMIGKQVADKILDGAELKFYKWDGDLKEMLASVKEKLNKVAEGWTRDDKNRCLQETEKSFKNSGKILRLIVL